MTAIDIFGILIPVTFLAMMGLEALFPARVWPARRGWRWIGVGFFIVLMTISITLPLLIPAPWFETYRVLDGSRLGVVGGVLIGFPVLTIFTSLWHRAIHSFDPLWRATHQLHHSPQRLDVAGSALFHPIDIAFFTLIQVGVMALLLGLNPLAVAIVGYIAAFYSTFQHLNMKTPQWLGYIIQRPEAHSVHHERGRHAMNYSDFPLWDMVLGSWRNPKDFVEEVGFEEPADRRMGSMLLFADVNAPIARPGTRGATVQR